ncbi:MAG: hypothetical protein HY721_25725 [Planctomycetes bacterium]|nr:hypothetical protein [Planctomycetota bacterium]
MKSNILQALQAALVAMCAAACAGTQPSGDGLSSANRLSPADKRLLDDLERAGCLFFWENGHPETGLVKDRSRAGGPRGLCGRLLAGLEA